MSDETSRAMEQAIAAHFEDAYPEDGLGTLVQFAVVGYFDPFIDDDQGRPIHGRYAVTSSSHLPIHSIKGLLNEGIVVSDDIAWSADDDDD